jgi:tRNA modification GTPase
MDTAGLRDDVVDVVEREGVRRATERVERSDVVVWVSAPDVEGSMASPPGVIPDLWVVGKSDTTDSILGRNESPHPILRLSAKTGAGIGEFVEALIAHVREHYLVAESALVMNARQREAVRDSIRFLNNSLGMDSSAFELKAEEIRMAAMAIGRVTGRTDVEEWLGSIFSRFCIGK